MRDDSEVADPCVECGTDSVATCLACGRRVCNRHMVISASRDSSPVGVALSSGLSPVRLVHPTGHSIVNQTDGPFLSGYLAGGARCHQCRQHDGQTAVEEADASAARAAEEANEARHELREVSKPSKLAQLIRQGGDRVAADEYRAAWSRVVASGSLPEPDFELVRLQMRHRLFGSPEEKSRGPAWHCATYKDDQLLVDATGRSWLVHGDYWHRIAPLQPPFKDALRVVPAGEELRIRRYRFDVLVENGKTAEAVDEWQGASFPRLTLGILEQGRLP